MRPTEFEPKAANLLNFLNKGYSLRELLWKGISLKVYSRILSFLRFRFYFRGRGVDIDRRAVVDGARFIWLGDRVWLQRGAWLTIPLVEMKQLEDRPYLTIEEGTRIGPNCTIGAANNVRIGKYVLFGPNVTVVDHMHEYRDITRPVSGQGIFTRGEVVIEENAWLGANVVVYSTEGTLTIGRNSVVAANSVVRDSVPPSTVVSGNPARPIKAYDTEGHTWKSVDNDE